MKNLLAIVTVITLILSILFYSQIAAAILVIGYTLAGVLGLVAMLVGFFGAWFLAERMRIFRAQRIETEKHAHVMTISDNGETWVRDTDQKASWRNLTGTPALYVNGKQHRPDDWEIDLHRQKLAAMAHTRTAAAQVIPGQAQLLPETVQPIDLLTALDTVQRGLIVGASDSGKTTLLQWLVYRRQQVSKVVVIDPHSWPDKWAGCYTIGSGRNYAEIGRALMALVQVMDKRYDEIGRGAIREGKHPRLTILIDEWRAITQNLGKSASEAIKALLTESRKAAFSVFVASHSDRAKPLGLEGEYDLKDGFAIVRLAVVAGQRQATIDTGNGEQPATLPGPFAPMPQVAPKPDFELDLRPQPTTQEQQIIELHAAGESLSEIARQVYGSKGGKQVSRIKQVIGQFN